MLQIGGTQSTVNLFKVHYLSLPFQHYLLSITLDRMIIKRMVKKGQQNWHVFKPILIIFHIITQSIKMKYNLQSKLALCLTLHWLLVVRYKMDDGKETRTLTIFLYLWHTTHASHTPPIKRGVRVTETVTVHYQWKARTQFRMIVFGLLLCYWEQ